MERWERQPSGIFLPAAGTLRPGKILMATSGPLADSDTTLPLTRRAFSSEICGNTFHPRMNGPGWGAMTFQELRLLEFTEHWESRTQQIFLGVALAPRPGPIRMEIYGSSAEPVTMRRANWVI